MAKFVFTFENFLNNLKQALISQKFRVLFSLAFFIILLGTTFFHFTEGWNWIDSFYFSVMTLTTVGYGDLVPTTILSKIFSVIYILVGIGLLLFFVNVVASQAIKNRISEEIDKEFFKKKKK